MGATATAAGTTTKAPAKKTGKAAGQKGEDAGRRRRPAAKGATSQAASAERPKQGVRNKNLGRKGEEAAARYLEQRGYTILERNWTCFAGEADIIARDEDWLVFVEVKTRRSTEKGFPSEAVNVRKRDKYEKIALAYAADHSYTEVPVRFDVVSIVVIAKDKAMIRHHMNAFSR